MLTAYIQAAMRRAKYELVPEDQAFYGWIPGFEGVYSYADTLEACREELQEVLEEWIVLGLRHDDPLPVVDGIDLSIKAVV
ncbi:MAG: type II toxin-antitoxin system HicB family antitoxin [Chloroflexi bacterium]|nr:type II toxin-antitoxin system HicB family antitoxin [Chloroflexota bacterium]